MPAGPRSNRPACGSRGGRASVGWGTPAVTRPCGRRFTLYSHRRPGGDIYEWQRPALRAIGTDHDPRDREGHAGRPRADPVETGHQSAGRMQGGRDRDTGLYALGRKIGMFHKVMKSGCRAEASRVPTAARLANLIEMMRIVAWRVPRLTMPNRTDPDSPRS